MRMESVDIVQIQDIFRYLQYTIFCFPLIVCIYKKKISTTFLFFFSLYSSEHIYPQRLGGCN